MIDDTNNKVYDIVKTHSFEDDEYKRLTNLCEPVESEKEGEEIAEALFRTLTDSKYGVGLSANQIGINKRVFVVHVKEPLYFINPVLTEIKEAGTFVYIETCLSMPGVFMRTERCRHIIISADNLKEKCEIDISNISQDNVMQSTDAFEIAALQHEYDHINGILMLSKQYHTMPFNVIKTFDRNDKVIIKKENTIKSIKYKLFDKYRGKGWTIQ